MENATPMGADASIADRIEAHLAQQDSPPPEAPAEAEDTKPADAQAEQESEAAEQPAPETEAPVQPEPEVEAAEAEPAEQPETDAEGVTEYELSDISNLFGVNESALTVTDDGNLLINTKIDGQTGTIALQDVIKSYQLEGHLNNKSMEVSEQKKALDSEKETFAKQSQQKLQQLDNALQVAFSELYQDFERVDWATLERSDPSEYSALRLKFQDREARLKHAMTALDEERGKAQNQQVEQLQEAREANLKELLAKVPEWSDPKVFEQGRADLKKNLQSYGFTDEEVSSVIDHRFILLARDAMKYRELQDKKETVIKKVKVAPKTAKSGAKQDTQKQDPLKTSRSRVRKSGGRDKQAFNDYLSERGII